MWPYIMVINLWRTLYGFKWKDTCGCKGSPPHLRSAKLTLDNFPLAFMWAVKACSCLCPHCPLSSFSFDAALFFELLKCFFLLGVSAVFAVQFLLLLFFPWLVLCEVVVLIYREQIKLWHGSVLAYLLWYMMTDSETGVKFCSDYKEHS